MFINKKNLNYFDNNNIYVFIIKNIIRKILFILNIFDNIIYKFK